MSTVPFDAFKAALGDYLQSNRPDVRLIDLDELEMFKAFQAGMSPIVYGRTVQPAPIGTILNQIQRDVFPDRADGPAIFRAWAYAWLAGIHFAIYLSLGPYGGRIGDVKIVPLVFGFFFFVASIAYAAGLAGSSNAWDQAHGRFILVWHTSTFLVGLAIGYVAMRG